MRIALSLFCCVLWTVSARADAVRLQIVGPDKKPVAGAEVHVVESSGVWWERKTDAPLQMSSDAEGKVAFESRNPLVAPKIEPLSTPIGGNVLFARIIAPGMAVAGQQLKAGDNEIALQAGQNWEGVALDEAQKPVAGVKVALNQFRAVGEGRTMYLPSGLKFETTTGEDGKWSFSNVPREGTAQISVADPRFVREALELSLHAPAAPPLFLERGAVIKGRLVTPEGQPAADVPLYPGGNNRSNIGFNDFRTAPDGSFLISGLSPGNYYLQNINLGGREKSLPFIIEPKSVNSLKAGETRDIGDWKTESGIQVKGKVVESGTKKPIVQAHVSLWGRGNGQGQSDTNGEFAFRASEDVSQGTISARGFGQLQKPVPQALNGVINLGTIELKRGLTVKGTLKDKNGRGVGGLHLYTQDAQGAFTYTNTNNDGNFSFDALEAGNYTLKVQGAKLVREKKFSVVAGQETPLLEAVVDVETRADTPKTVAGRALDSAGNPVAGAKISLRMTTPSRSSTSATVISGSDGRFETQITLPNGTPKVTKVTRPGLLFSRGDFKIVDGVWRADLIFQARGAALRGRVLSSAGQPAPRAWVSLAGRNDVPIVQSDENGAFSIPDVALEGVTLLASDGRTLGQLPIEKAGGNIEIALPPAVDYDSATLADEILPDSRLGHLWGERWQRTWDTLGTARMEAAILRARAGNRGWDWIWNEYLRQLARRDPQSFLARGDELLSLASPNNLEAPAILARLRAQSDNPDDRAKARAWLETQSKVTLALDANGVTSLLRQGTVAEALRAGDGAKSVDFAAQIAAQLTDKVRAERALEWGAIAALIGPQVFDNLLQDWAGNAKLNAFAGAVRTLSGAGNVTGARDMLSRMEATLPAAQAATDEVRVEGFVQKPKEIVAQARGEVAELVAKTDPNAAFEMAKETDDYRQTELLLGIGKHAARLGQTELAARALRQVFEAKFGNVEPGVSAAQIALGFDVKLADELFRMAWEKSNPRSENDDFSYRPSVAAYAGARAKGWAGESRILIEREWAERIRAYKPPEDNDYDGASESLKSLVGAMAKIDARRALEMAAQLPEKGNLKAQARGQIALALLAKE